VPRDALGDVVRHADGIVDVGPGAGEEGGRVAAAGPPAEVARSPESRTAPDLAAALG
jgi:excinuclease ABC subunit A